MEGQVSGTNEDQGTQAPVDPWISAFAALEPKGEEADAKPDDQQGEQQDGDTGTEQAGGQQVPDMHAQGDGSGDDQDSGGLDTPAGEADVKDGSAFAGMHEVTEESIKQFEERLDEDVRNQAIREVAAELVKQGVRNTNGQLGATLDDPDICRRDDDGVPRFYNPETGREFTGDNPRRQAQEWVDDYNRELARIFNNTCEQYEKQLKEQAAPRLSLMKFAPKYEKLDGIRRGMLDTVISDYEIKDNDGKVVGYSVDLDKALAQVDRQIAMIQEYAKSRQQQAEPAEQKTPALDMKTSSGAVQAGDMAAPASLAEAMERIQDAQLSKLKKD